MRRIETVVTVFEGCEVCEGTGLLHPEGRTIDCWKCDGRGVVQVSKKKMIEEVEKNEQLSSGI